MTVLLMLFVTEVAKYIMVDIKSDLVLANPLIKH